MESRVVQSECDVLKITRGDTLTVKRRLNAGERRAMFEAMRVNGEYQRSLVGIAAVIAYLVDWSLTDGAGKLLVIAGKPDTVKRAHETPVADRSACAVCRAATSAAAGDEVAVAARAAAAAAFSTLPRL